MKKLNKRKKPINGRQPADIDWEYVKQLAQCHCTGPMIAACLGIHSDTLYARIEKDLGMTFTTFSGIHKEKGCAKLLQKQFECAFRESKPSESMLIWLGKQKLHQRDRFPDEAPTQYFTVYLNDRPYPKDESIKQ